MYGITCPRCGATITNRGASHCGAGSQWECRCGYIEQDRGQGRDVSRTPTRPEPPPWHGRPHDDQD